jgi:FtsH-binding integral membrane protein
MKKMDFQQNPALTQENERTYNTSFHKLMRMFTISLLVAFIGTAVGIAFIPPALILPLVIVEIGMLIAAMFVRRKGKSIGYGFLFTFVFISGITLFPAINYYTAVGGASLVNTAFILTVAIFAGLSTYAYYSKRDFSFLRGFLMVGLFALIGFSIIGIFVPGMNTGALGLIIGFFGVLVFSGFILYDISQYKNGVPEEMIPLAVLGLYLSFINLFLYLLQILGILSSDD